MIVGQLIAQPSDQFPISEDFTEELDQELSEQIIVATASSRNYATQLDTTTTFLAPGPFVQIDQGLFVTTLKQAGGGAHGESHIVTLTVTTNYQNIYQHEVEVIVTES